MIGLAAESEAESAPYLLRLEPLQIIPRMDCFRRHILMIVAGDVGKYNNSSA
jgi:hypothetical protein